MAGRAADEAWERRVRKRTQMIARGDGGGKGGAVTSVVEAERWGGRRRECEPRSVSIKAKERLFCG